VTFRTAEIDLRSLRPQAFGRGHVRSIKDPLIEPLWGGERVLFVIPETGAEPGFIDAEGEELEGPALDAIVAELRANLRADTVALDGYLTRQPNTPSAMSPSLGLTMPSAQQMAGQMLFGRRSANAPKAPGRAEPAIVDPDAAVAFVAVDLLAIDDQGLLDIPLLERKRILDTAFEQTSLLRLGVYVRPPVDGWLVAWRSLGFHELAYKAANGRYLPGKPNPDWARIRIPLD
jgi:hypothetical protein